MITPQQRGFLINMQRITDIEKLIIEIKNNIPDVFEHLIDSAIEFTKKYHKDELRISGEPFIIHALNVGRNCAQIQLDTDSIIVGMIHQITSKKTKSPSDILKIKAEIKDTFGENVLSLFNSVEHITEYTNLKYGSDLKVLQKYLIAGVEDIRPTLIKICDVLDDAQTCDSFPKPKLNLFAQKMINVYSPLCEYFNLSEFKRIIEESVFEFQNPEDFKSVDGLFKLQGIEDSVIEKYSEYLRTIVTDILGYNSNIYGRAKGKYSTHQKLYKYLKEGKGKNITSIMDLIAFTIIGKSESDCYSILHAIQSLCLNDPTHFDDYILLPKPNGYKGIHLCIKIPEILDIWIEVQIQTDEMHYTNTFGPASHIAYKAAKERFPKASLEFNWVEQLHNAIKEHKNLRETNRSIPILNTFLNNRIFVQTPKGKIIELEKDSTAIDFAYAIHTQIGNSAISAIVNNKQCKLSQILKPGDVVEIVTRKGKTHPDKLWLEFASSLTTKREIREALRS